MSEDDDTGLTFLPDRNALNHRIALSMTSCTMVIVMGYGKVSRMLQGKIRAWCAMMGSNQHVPFAEHVGECGCKVPDTAVNASHQRLFIQHLESVNKWQRTRSAQTVRLVKYGRTP